MCVCVCVCVCVSGEGVYTYGQQPALKPAAGNGMKMKSHSLFIVHSDPNMANCLIMTLRKHRQRYSSYRRTKTQTAMRTRASIT